MILKTKMLDYQRKAYDKLRRLKVGALFMDMGVGKTRVALELIADRINANKVQFVIWLCPCSVKEDIANNISTHSDLVEGKQLHICGIETLSTSISENIKLLNIVESTDTFLIIDESSLVKNPYTLRSKNIVRIAEKCHYKLILNGTPITRNEADLFNQFYILDWRILGYKSYWSFDANHVVRDDKNPKRIKKINNIDYLAKRIAPYTYECKKEDVLILPDKRYYQNTFYMTNWQEENYAYAITELLDEIDEFHPETIYQFLGALQSIISGFKLKIVYNNRRAHIIPAYGFDKPLDNPRIRTMRECLPEDEKCIIFCNYVREIEEVAQMLNEEKCGNAVKFYGEMNLKKRNQSLELFRNKSQYFVAHKQCGAYGLNLQFCNHVIFLSHDWNWGTREQAENRVHRIGQNDDVYITDVVCSRSIDIKILDCLNRKENLSNEFKNNLADKNKLIKFAKGEI